MRTMLEAVIKAAEIQGAFNTCNSFNKLGLDHTTLVKLASTAVSCWLMGLTEEQTCAALSHVFMDGCALRVFRAGTNTIPRKSWAAGDACSRAVQLALLARAGQAGARTVLTMPRWGFYENVWRGDAFVFPEPLPGAPSRSPFQTYVIERTAFKLHPCEGHSLYAIQAMHEQARRLRARGLDPDRDVARIQLRACRPIVLILDKPGELHNYADRDHSIQYVLGVTLLKGEPPVIEDYRDESPWASSAAMRAVAAKMEVVEDEGFSKEYYAHHRAEPSPPVAGVTITLTSGEVMEEVIGRDCPGHPANPKTSQGVVDKFRRNMKSGGFTREVTEKIMELVKEDDVPVTTLVDLLAA